MQVQNINIEKTQNSLNTLENKLKSGSTLDEGELEALSLSMVESITYQK